MNAVGLALTETKDTLLRRIDDEYSLTNRVVLGKRIKWLILPLHESETDRHLIGLSG